MEELRKHLATYLSPEAGLVGVLLSDREGVPLLRVTTDQVSRASCFANKMLRKYCKLHCAIHCSLVSPLAVSGHGDEAELPVQLRGDESGGGRQARAGPQLSAGGGVRAAPGGPHPARGRHPHPSGHHRGQHRSMKILTNLDFKINFAS